MTWHNFFQQCPSPSYHSYFGPTAHLLSSPPPKSFLPLFSQAQHNHQQHHHRSDQEQDGEHGKPRGRGQPPNIIPATSIFPFLHPLHTLFAFNNQNWINVTWACIKYIYRMYISFWKSVPETLCILWPDVVFTPNCLSAVCRPCPRTYVDVRAVGGLSLYSR